jgi:diaminopimelate decarboxylase
LLDPFIDAVGRVLNLVDNLHSRGIELKHLDLGGGLGVRYDNEAPPSPFELVSALGEALGNRPYEIILEPGRAIAANAGVLLTRVEYLKQHSGKHFAIIDGAMNDLIRPSLYGAYQDITPVELNGGGVLEFYDIVGPICETGDFFGKRRELPLSAGTLLAVRSVGAYGFAMSSNYNDRPKAAEVMVDRDQSYLIRARQDFEDLWRGEQILPV